MRTAGITAPCENGAFSRRSPGHECNVPRLGIDEREKSSVEGGRAEEIGFLPCQIRRTATLFFSSQGAEEGRNRYCADRRRCTSQNSAISRLPVRVGMPVFAAVRPVLVEIVQAVK